MQKIFFCKDLWRKVNTYYDGVINQTRRVPPLSSDSIVVSTCPSHGRDASSILARSTFFLFTHHTKKNHKAQSKTKCF